MNIDSFCLETERFPNREKEENQNVANDKGVNLEEKRHLF